MTLGAVLGCGVRGLWVSAHRRAGKSGGPGLGCGGHRWGLGRSVGLIGEPGAAQRGAGVRTQETGRTGHRLSGALLGPDRAPSARRG